MTAIAYQRETNDWRGFTLRRFDEFALPIPRYVDYTGAWSYQIVAKGARPTGAWLGAVTLNGQKGIDIKNLTPGYYWLFFRIDGQAPYVPELDPIDLVIK